LSLLVVAVVVLAVPGVAVAVVLGVICITPISI
jgi:hypothetical protein